MPSSRLTYLFYRYFEEMASEEETAELMELLAKEENETGVQSLMEEAWTTFQSSRERFNEVQSMEMLKAALSAAPARPRPVRLFTWTRVAAAAAVIGVMVIGLYWLQSRNPQPTIAAAATEQKSDSAAVAYTRQYRLPDSSIVTLHAGSHLEAPMAFSGSTREVSLTGEAYFDIAPDPAHPFIIHAGGVNTTVLGTAFNIKAYPSSQRVIVSVTNGKVKVEKETRLLAVLERDDQMTYSIPSGLAEEQKVDAASVVTGWTKQDMLFEKSSFADVADVLNRRYGATIEFRNQKLRSCMIKAYFNGTEPLAKVLEVLCIISNAHYTREDDGRIIIDGPGC
ncbi:MAG: FecR domain-containing protein [Bacteroidetes bacterium]|nr:FecR domain-containing protein [Bacteroidota bacterium]